MAIHGLTRVTCIGDKVVVVAGPIPHEIQSAMVTSEPVHTAMTPVRHVEKQKNKPPKFVSPPKPQAEATPVVEKENK